MHSTWHWYRFEYQARGSTHTHGCAKLKNDPGIWDLVKKAAVGWLTAQRLSHSDMNLQQSDAQRNVEEGEAAKSAALQYSDWLVTTMNAAIPDEQWHTPVPHVSQ